MQKISIHILLCIVVGLLMSCKPTVPSKYIQPDEFEDILYDKYVAQAMANDETAGDSVSFNSRLYWLGVLKKHDVTEAEFDSSLVYYTRHAEKMQDMYKNLAIRIQEDAMALGAEASDLKKFEVTSVGDTANIWTGERSIVLMQYAPYNVVSYSIQADSAFHKGDRFIFTFDTKFIFQDGYKDGIAMLTMRLGNDSIVSRNIHMSSDSHYTIDISDNERLGVKELKGFICLSRGRESVSSTLRMLFVDNIALVRMHKKEVEDEKKGSADSAEVKKSADSIKVDSALKDKPVAMEPEKDDRKKWKPEPKDMPLTR